MTLNLFVFIFLNYQSISNQLTVSVKLTGFSSNKGKAFLMLLDKNEKELDKKIVSISNKSAECIFEVKKADYYAIKVFHDENNNQKLDTNVLGIPNEKWGVSNNLKARFGPPNFKKMLFEVKGNSLIQINLQ
jgi:uncharacterized protein (DUF2141 family)